MFGSQKEEATLLRNMRGIKIHTERVKVREMKTKTEEREKRENNNDMSRSMIKKSGTRWKRNHSQKQS